MSSICCNLLILSCLYDIISIHLNTCFNNNLERGDFILNRNDNILRFYLLATTLKNKIRQGSIYWNVSAPRRESIAEHVYDTCMLAIAIHSEYHTDINIQKVILMLVIHELEEIIIGDITPFDKITIEQKEQMGKEAVKDIVSTLSNKDEYIYLTNEFNEAKTKEAMFAHLCDKLDFDLQMKLYTDKGYIKLDKDNASPVFRSPIIQEMIKNGVNSPNEIFYNYDLPKYNQSSEFREILDYAYKLNLAELLESYYTDNKA